MKIKYILITIVLFILHFVASAQPIPPSSPDGEKVPVGGALFLLFAALVGLGVMKLRKKGKS
ncbi:MAG: hypothetical protein K9H26_11400 [Prolixibacteraceae bacterium]|nr:hypothetical protein [Prolixibacteraceae bacterium]